MIATKDKTNGGIIVLTEQENEIFELIKSNPALTMPEIANMLCLSKAEVNKTFRSLKRKECVKRANLGELQAWIISK